MTDIYQHLEIILIYFIYGLGFLAMGMAIALEMVRSSSIVNAKMLIPLAGFGLVHGIYEWLEIFLLQLTWGGYEFPVWLSIFRLSLLSISFLFLLYFGLLTRRSLEKSTMRRNFTGYVLMGIYTFDPIQRFYSYKNRDHKHSTNI
jgi:hypothetical protein